MSSCFQGSIIPYPTLGFLFNNSWLLQAAFWVMQKNLPWKAVSLNKYFLKSGYRIVSFHLAVHTPYTVHPPPHPSLFELLFTQHSHSVLSSYLFSTNALTAFPSQWLFPVDTPSGTLRTRDWKLESTGQEVCAWFSMPGCITYSIFPVSPI